MRSTRRLLMVIILLAVFVAGAMVLRSYFAARRSSADQLSYQAAAPDKVALERIATDLGPITRLKISPDGKLLLVGILTGEVYAFQRQESDWVRQTQPVVKIATAFPGFPPEENGLTGIAFGSDYAVSGDVFFTYAFQGDTIKNRVARATIRRVQDEFIVSDLVDIFEANSGGGSSHQIQGIESLLIDGQSYVLFLIGEGFKAERARNMALEAGKLMLMRRDGSDPQGDRPYPEEPKIQAIGIRNAPDLASNPFDPAGRLAIVDTGPDSYDRFIYGKFVAAKEEALQPIDLGWDGTTESLRADRPDGNVDGNPNMVLERWNPTHTATNIVFHPGKGVIPASTSERTSVLVSFFGRTGETGAGKPGREILLGEIRTGGQPQLTWKPLIGRSKTGLDTVGHPIALERDPVTNDLLFADIIEGAIYRAIIKDR